jgi:hypothetical protein
MGQVNSSRKICIESVKIKEPFELGLIAGGNPNALELLDRERKPVVNAD